MKPEGTQPGTILRQCPACRGTSLGPFRDGIDYHYGIEGTFHTDQCAACHLVFLNPMPSVADLAPWYPDDYYSYQPPQLHPGWKRRLAEWTGLRKQTYMPKFERPGRVLDLGCGAGHYLLKLKELGWDVHGSELSKGAARAGNSIGLDIRTGELMDGHFETAEFDFVRSNHSFEHIPNPNEVLAEIHRILKPGGTLFIGVPNLDSFWARHFGRHWWYFGLPVHTCTYDRANLPLLLKRHGFRVSDVRWNSDFASALGSWQIRHNAGRGLASSDGRLIRSWPLKILGHLAARLSDRLHRGDCIEVIATRE